MSVKKYTVKECRIKTVDSIVYVDKDSACDIPHLFKLRNLMLSALEEDYNNAYAQIMDSFEVIFKDISVQKEKDETLEHLRKLSRDDALDVISAYFKEDRPKTEDRDNENH